VTPSILSRLLAAGRWLTRWPNGAIAGFVIVQLLVPLHYYTVRRDDHDERFAWRMFSSMRLLTCEVEFRINDQPIEPLTEFHDAWLALARRGRRTVVEAMAARLCHEHPGATVRALLTCHPVRGEAESIGGFDLCTIPTL
jgi:hypothetical protein